MFIKTYNYKTDRGNDLTDQLSLSTSEKNLKDTLISKVRQERPTIKEKDPFL